MSETIEVFYEEEEVSLHVMYQHADDAGIDLKYHGEKQVVLLPGDRKLLGTGLKMAIPSGYEAQVRPRSGLAIKQGVTVINSPGTIDAGYRGEIKVGLINHSDEAFIVKPGMRVAQLVICKLPEVKFTYVRSFKEHSLDKTERGEAGFGSTGLL